jgi:hypothetical protein
MLKTTLKKYFQSLRGEGKNFILAKVSKRLKSED